MAERLDATDIQGPVFRGYGNLRAARYLMMQLGDPAAARNWLAAIAGDITSDEKRPGETALNIAFTPSGLLKLGLLPEALNQFSLEFLDGMATSHRSRLFGDVGENAPERWEWGGPTTPTIDILLMVFARDEERLGEQYTAVSTRARDYGLQEVTRLGTYDLGFNEHFGFRDGVSQPVIAESSRTAHPDDTIKAGEFVLGYVNEHGQFTPRPLLDRAADPHHILPLDPAGSGRPDLGRNGAYLVFRQLSQDVLGFWRFMDAATRNSDGTSNPAERTKLAAKMVGRWPGGAPLAKSPESDDPHLSDFNDFTYYDLDRYGFGCPIGAHVRRTNPRDSLPPSPGTGKSTSVTKRHRLLRRGREYGPPVDPAALYDSPASRETGDERGLHFICICGNIARQFEFVQHTWVMNPSFDGIYNGADPLLGPRHSWDSTFTVQDQPLRRQVPNLPRFITVRGGAYFFMPGIRALRYLASL